MGQRLYPEYAASPPRQKWGISWLHLVDWVRGLPSVHPQALAFSLMMRRLQTLVGGSFNSPCFEPDCTSCLLGVLERYEGTERDLMDEYFRTLDEVEGFLARRPQVARSQMVA